MTPEEFKNQLLIHPFGTDYDHKMLIDFFDYWSEPNKKGKMRWELEKTWDLSRRLKRWFDNHNKWNNGHTNSQTSNKPGTSEARVNGLRNW